MINKKKVLEEKKRTLQPASNQDGDKQVINTHTTTQARAPCKPAVDQIIQNHLGRHLKAAYDDLVKQPVPDKFHRLLAKLANKEEMQ